MGEKVKITERQFLHDIGSPLGTALFLVDTLLEMAKEKGEENVEFMQLTSILEALNKARTLIEERRQIVKAEEQK